MTERLAYLWPEIVLFLATCVVMLMGLSPSAAARRACAWVAGVGLFIAGVLALLTTPDADAENAIGLMPNLVPYVKAVGAGVGILLLPLLAGTVDRAEERAIARGERKFDPLRVTRGEFFAFYLFSITGLMLTASADDLIWLFLALELTSLPTYIMVTISTMGTRSQESGVKYFFLGALGASTFLMGFALLYGGTGTTHLSEMPGIFYEQAVSGGLNPIAVAGLVLSFIGIGFKIAAVPMHAYTADVYQGASSSVSAMLAFVPKTAGFVALMLLGSAVGWTYLADGNYAFASLGDRGQLPEELRMVLWGVAALTMTVGNVLAVMQTSAKRMLAYSSIAHSGYMLVGIIAGPGLMGEGFNENGLAAVLFYLLAYGIMNTGAFAVLASLERRASDEDREEGKAVEVDNVDELRGLCKNDPVLGWTLVICSLSLLGFPPLVGFFGKIPLFTAGVNAGEITLIVILGLNSAMAAFYYLRLVNVAMFDRESDPERTPVRTLATARVNGALAAGVGVVVLTASAGFAMSWSDWATTPGEATSELAAIEPPAELMPIEPVLTEPVPSELTGAELEIESAEAAEGVSIR